MVTEVTTPRLRLSDLNLKPLSYNPFMWIKLLYVVVGGAVGAVARVELARWVERFDSEASPINLGLLVVNVLGCFVFGVVWTVIDKHFDLNHAASWALLAGF